MHRTGISISFQRDDPCYSVSIISRPGSVIRGVHFRSGTEHLRRVLFRSWRSSVPVGSLHMQSIVYGIRTWVRSWRLSGTFQLLIWSEHPYCQPLSHHHAVLVSRHDVSKIMWTHSVVLGTVRHARWQLVGATLPHRVVLVKRLILKKSCNVLLRVVRMTNDLSQIWVSPRGALPREGFFLFFFWKDVCQLHFVVPVADSQVLDVIFFCLITSCELTSCKSERMGQPKS